MNCSLIIQRIAWLILISFTLSSCATVFAGRYNKLVFTTNSTPAAQIFIDGEYVGEAPGKLKLKKWKIQHGSILEIKANDFETQEYLILRKQHTWFTIWDILLAGPGLAVDYATGNIYQPIPRKFSYTLQPVKTSKL